ncbi:MAG: Type 1 glutamine amidotransferase-like domain-containing protein, partial [Longimicrobiales bacterium]
MGWMGSSARHGRLARFSLGISAGMLCWFEDGLTDSFGDLQRLNDGLAFIKASACPHYDGEPIR